MAKSLTRQAFGALPDTLAAIEAEEKTNALREANFRYEPRRKEDKFSTALATLREQYLQEVFSIHKRCSADPFRWRKRRGRPGGGCREHWAGCPPSQVEPCVLCCKINSLGNSTAIGESIPCYPSSGPHRGPSISSDRVSKFFTMRH
jgi:hypothetical protein